VVWEEEEWLLRGCGHSIPFWVIWWAEQRCKTGHQRARARLRGDRGNEGVGLPGWGGRHTVRGRVEVRGGGTPLALRTLLVLDLRLGVKGKQTENNNKKGKLPKAA
jgi:hypothetical protein